ncbi:hypothetical protein J2127_000564 [Methanococcus voltae]|uniref:TFIIB-type zinc ribbon-containing protein n=1 Tax=Methanococcus voltae TaxID=2188 RepID=UPI001AE227B7|nr:TFIIB-type zinc ribbon-containing protein [Methanococcus voltae]MBP2143409.1 hypothetical protein [Methanococcus voltae]
MSVNINKIKFDDGYAKKYDKRIVIDRVYVSIQCPFLFSVLGNGFNKDIYDNVRKNYSQFVQRITEKKDGGKTGDFHFRIPVEVWEDGKLESNLQGEEIASISISFRQPHVARGYFNMNRLYMSEHGLNPYNSSYRDDNVLPISIREDKNNTLLKEYSRLFINRINEYKREYYYYLKELFGIDIEKLKRDLDRVKMTYDKLIEVSVQSAEVCVEWLNCESLQFNYITEARKNNYLKVYGDLTQTEYYTSPKKGNKVQFKRYQKGAGINRHEFTWHSELSRQWIVEDIQYLPLSIFEGVNESYAHFGFDFETMRPLKLSGESVLQDYADWWKLPLDYVKTVLYGKSYVLKFDRNSKGVRERLKSKGLIVPLEKELGGKRGLWRWSDTVQKIRLSLQGCYVCPVCNSVMRYDEMKHRHVCEHCGRVDDHSIWQLGDDQLEEEYGNNSQQ